MLWLRWLVAGLSNRRTGFDSGSLRVRSVVDKTAGFPPSTSIFPCQYYSTSAQHTSSIFPCQYYSTSAQHTSSCNVSYHILPKNNALSQIGGLCIEKYFFLIFKGLLFILWSRRQDQTDRLHVLRFVGNFGVEHRDTLVISTDTDGGSARKNSWIHAIILLWR